MDKSTISNNGQTVKEKINAMLPSFSKGQKEACGIYSWKL